MTHGVSYIHRNVTNRPLPGFECTYLSPTQDRLWEWSQIEIISMLIDKIRTRFIIFPTPNHHHYTYFILYVKTKLSFHSFIVTLIRKRSAPIVWKPSAVSPFSSIPRISWFICLQNLYQLSMHPLQIQMLGAWWPRAPPSFFSLLWFSFPCTSKCPVCHFYSKTIADRVSFHSVRPVYRCEV